MPISMPATRRCLVFAYHWPAMIATMACCLPSDILLQQCIRSAYNSCHLSEVIKNILYLGLCKQNRPLYSTRTLKHYILFNSWYICECLSPKSSQTNVSWNGVEKWGRKKTLLVSISQFQFERVAKRGGIEREGERPFRVGIKIFIGCESRAWEFSH